MVNFERLVTLINDIYDADPIPFQNVNVDPVGAMSLIFNSIWEKYQTEWKLVDRDKTEELMLAVIVKVVADNFYLNTKVIMLGEGDVES